MDKKVIRVLLVEDSKPQARLVELFLEESAPLIFQAERAERLSKAKNALQVGSFDIVLLDLSLPDSDGMDTVKAVREQNRQIPIVVLTGLQDEAMALESLHAGAQDYLVKGDVSGDQLRRTIRYAIERQQTLSELERLAKIKTDFLALVSHELRTPIALFKEAVNLILDGLVGQYDDGVKSCLVISQSSSLRLETLVNDLLDMAAMDAGHLTLTLATHNVCPIVAHSVEQFERSAADKQVKLSFETGKEEEYFARVDRNRLMQILTNLLSNALKFVQPPEGWVQARLLREKNWIRIEIEDNGCGIKEEDQERIFQRFEQTGNSLPSQPGGTGLGLAITKELVEMHGGQLGVHSEYGKGSRFFLLLPLETPESPAPLPSPAVPDTNATTVTRQEN